MIEQLQRLLEKGGLHRWVCEGFVAGRLWGVVWGVISAGFGFARTFLSSTAYQGSEGWWFWIPSACTRASIVE